MSKPVWDVTQPSNSSLGTLNDGLHPGDLGTTKIANYYINMLEL